MKTNAIQALCMATAWAFLTCAFDAQASEPKGDDAPVININTAGEKELSFLPGIGASKAKAIIAHREKKPFKKVEDLMRVKGIGRKSFTNIRKYLTITGPTTANKKIKPPKGV